MPTKPIILEPTLFNKTSKDSNNAEHTKFNSMIIYHNKAFFRKSAPNFGPITLQSMTIQRSNECYGLSLYGIVVALAEGRYFPRE